MNFNQTYKNAALAGAGFMVAGGAIYALINVATQYLTSSMGLASTSMAFWQYFIAFVALLPWLKYADLRNLKSQQLTLQIIRVIFSALGVQCWIYALANGVPIWQAIALLMTSPFFVTLAAALWLKEPVGFPRISATFIGFVGGMIILEPWSDEFQLIALLPVAAAAFWAGASILVKQLSYTESASSITLYLLLLLTPINAGLAVIDGFSLPTLDMVWLLLAVGVLTAVAQGAYAMAYKAADAVYVQPFDHVKLPLNIVAGAVVFGWAPTGNLWLGATLIIGSSLFIMYREHKRHVALPA
ncbi:MAG: DMT family transporter [Rhizobiales bacterium]|nr:DMT family transporter [Hyphomicrobiales bacterium]NRB15942.1 DMT family transporter [Hyphomicrobiales bacterium]